MVDKGAGRLVAARAAHRCVVPERPAEERLAAVRRGRGGVSQTAIEFEFGIGQEADVLHIGDECIEHLSGRLRAGEFIDDDVAHEVAQ